MIGAGLAVYAQTHTDFLASLPTVNGAPNFNLAIPMLFTRELPAGVTGLGVVALLAAAMSSLDSMINSLSAATLEDFVKRWSPKNTQTDGQELRWGRILTVAWGAMALIFAFYVDDIASTVLVAVKNTLCATLSS